jgi:RNA polymerase sigma-70 factor (ECF subfamily)
VNSNGSHPDCAPEADALSLTCLVLLEQLLPVERAAFLLHHVFGRSRRETACLVGVSEATCRRLLLRAQRVVRTTKAKIEAERSERQVVTNRFSAGVRNGDAHLLAQLLAPDAVAHVDAAGTPTFGRRAVARLLGHRSNDLAVDPVEISLEIREGLVQTVRIRGPRDAVTKRI